MPRKKRYRCYCLDCRGLVYLTHDVIDEHICASMDLLETLDEDTKEALFKRSRTATAPVAPGETRASLNVVKDTNPIDNDHDNSGLNVNCDIDVDAVLEEDLHDEDSDSGPGDVPVDERDTDNDNDSASASNSDPDDASVGERDLNDSDSDTEGDGGPYETTNPRAQKVFRALQHWGYEIFGEAFRDDEANKVFFIPDFSAIVSESKATPGTREYAPVTDPSPLGSAPTRDAMDQRLRSVLATIYQGTVARNVLRNELALVEEWANTRAKSQATLTRSLQFHCQMGPFVAQTKSLTSLMKIMERVAGAGDKEVIFARCALGCECLLRPPPHAMQSTPPTCRTCSGNKVAPLIYHTVTGYLRSLFCNPDLRRELIPGTELTRDSNGSDVYGSARMQDLDRMVTFREEDVVFLLCWDGVVVGDIRKKGIPSAWPVVLFNLSLPPSLRYKKGQEHCVLIAGGKASPKALDSYLVPLVLEFSLLSTTGVDVFDAKTNRIKRVRAFIYSMCADLPGTAKGLCLMGPNGLSGCPVCIRRAQILRSAGGGINRIYPWQREAAPVRSHRLILKTVLSDEPLNPKETGIKSASPLHFLPFQTATYPLASPDMMHAGGLNLCHEFLNYFVEGDGSDQSFPPLDKRFHGLVTERLKEVSLPRNFLDRDTRQKDWLLNPSSLTADEGLKLMSVLGPWLFYGFLKPTDYYLWVLWCNILRTLCGVCVSNAETNNIQARLDLFYENVNTEWSPLLLKPNFHTSIKHFAETIQRFGPPRATWLFAMERFQGVLKGLLRDMTRRDAAIPTVAAMKRVQTLLRHIRLQYPTIPELKVPKQCPKAVIIKGAHGFWSPVSAISDQARETLKSRCAKALITQDMIRYANGHPCVFTCTSTGATTSTKVSDLAQHIRVELFKQYAAVGLGAFVVPQDYVVTTDWYIWDVQAAATFTSHAYYHGHTYKHEDHHVWADWWSQDDDGGAWRSNREVATVQKYVVARVSGAATVSGTDAAFPLAEVVWWKLLDINDRDTIKTLFVGELSTNPDASLEAAIRFRVDAVPMSVVTPYSAGSRTAVVSMEDICLEHKLLMAPLRWIRGYRRGDLPYNAKVVLSTISSK